MKQTVIRLARTKPAMAVRRKVFAGSERYWEQRYAHGGNSGPGSYGDQARWKADVVNAWVAGLGVQSVIDWGCGDGNQLSLAVYPRYLGIDRSPSAVKLCTERFKHDPTKSFAAYDPDALWDPAGWFSADLALSMEVIFHLTEEGTYRTYMSHLFGSASKYVIICSNDVAGTEAGPTERHRRFTEWIAANAPDWQLEEVARPPAKIELMSQLYLYSRQFEAAAR